MRHPHPHTRNPGSASPSRGGSPDRERILGYVEAEFLGAGRIQFSVDEVAAGLGMSKKTFYHAFPSKDAMLEELIRRTTGSLSRRIDAVLAGERGFPGKVSALVAFLGTTYRGLLLPLSSEFHRYHPRLWHIVEEFRSRKIREVFTTLIEQGREEGFIREDLDRELFLLALTGIVRGIIQPAVLMEQRFNVSEAIEQIFGLVLGGSLTPEGRKALAKIKQRSTA